MSRQIGFIGLGIMGHGQAEDDFCSVVKMLEDLAQIEVKR